MKTDFLLYFRKTILRCAVATSGVLIVPLHAAANPEECSESLNLDRLQPIILQTERLILKPIDEVVASKVLQIWKDPRVLQMSHNRILTESEALFLIRDGIKSLGSQDRLLDKARFNFGMYFNNELIGTVSIQHSQQTSVVYHTKTNKPKGFWVSISYAFLPEAWGQHLASEAVARVVRFAFQDTFIGGIHGASARTNLGSQGVLKNNGFTQIAYDEHPTFIHFALSRHQWLNR